MRRVLVFATALLMGAMPAAAQVSGRAVALGSDTLDLNGRQLQLAGIDGLEFHQSCFVDGRPFACGASATRALQTLLDGIVVTCVTTGTLTGTAELAECTTSEGDVAENMVRQGWAVADRAQSSTYVAAEDAARAAGDGGWAGAFVAPWTYREDVAAIEQRYVQRNVPTLRAELEARLTADRAGIGVFAAVPVTFDSAATVEQELRARALEPGFIAGAIEERGVFTWAAIATALRDWRDIVVGGALSNAVAAAWADLEARPGPTVEVMDAATFYAAMTEAAAPLLAAGRHPVLLIAATDNPQWFRDWFAGAAPEGAEVGARDDAWPGYMGTIDGIDVYVAPVPNDQALLLPDDILNGVIYRRAADGTVVTVATGDATTPNDLVFRFARAISWSADEPIRIHYPYEVAVPHNGS